MELSSVSSEHMSPSVAPPLKVLIDARKLGDGGIGTYVDNLISGLLTFSSAEISVLVSPNCTVTPKWWNEVERIVDSAELYSIDELFKMGKRIDFSKFDLFHVPHFTLPFGIKIPTVVTVHDLIHIHHPERFFYPLVARPLIRSSLKRATKVLTVSRATERELSAISPSTKDKISVVPNALDPHFMSEAPELPTRFGLRIGDYFLVVLSNAKPHKGYKDLVKAYALVQKRMKNGRTLPRLAIVGRGSERIVVPSSLKNVIVPLGSVKSGELHSLYSGARALIVCSKAEGFCLPAIEAQACGTPVIARPIPAIKELQTENDFIADDMTVEALARCIENALDSEEDHEDRGVPLQHMQRFCREDISRAVLSVYRDAVGAGASSR